MKILIVDVEEGICKRLQRELKRGGFEVEYTTSPEGVVEMLHDAKREDKPYEILFLDLRIPKMDGFELLKEVREAQLDLDVIIITGYGDEDKAIEAIRLGAVDYLPKPISLEDLRVALFRVQHKRTLEETLRHSILVIDDEKYLCDRIKRELGKEGYHVAVAYDGDEGLDYFEENRVDVVIADIKMPKMSGLEMLKKCREISGDFVSLIITGHGDHETAIEALRLGVLNYLKKPVSLEELVTSVDKGIDLLILRRGFSARRRELEIETAVKEQYAKNLESMVEERTKEIKKLSDAVKAATESIVISDLEGKIIDVNEATLKMYGTDNKADLVWKSSFDFIAPEDRERAIAGMKEVMEKGYVKDRTYHVVIKDGSKLPVEMSVSIIKDAENEPIGFVAVTKDITERKRAEEKLRRSREQLRALTAWLAEVEESERKQLARELHDVVVQNFTVLGINLNIVRSKLPKEAEDLIRSRLEDSLALVEQTAIYIRNVIAGLRPDVLDDYGLLAALRWYGEQFSDRMGVAITVQGEEMMSRLPLAMETTLFRIAQEALSNVAKHAQATKVTVTLEEVEGIVKLAIADDGKGFDSIAIRRRRPGENVRWGLITMEERAIALGGQLRVESTPGKGTTIIVEVKR